MAGDELVPWLRPVIERDLSEWRECEAHFKAVRQREGDYHYFEARERVAQLEAELAVLDEHVIVHRGRDEDFFRRDLKVIAGRMPPGVGLVTIGESEGDFGCVTCHYERGGHVQGFGYCNTVRLLGYGYRFRTGYRKAEWKP